jgi:hypothetical protein
MDGKNNIAALRARLSAKLDDANLDLFIQAHFPGVIDYIGPAMGKADKIDELMAYCHCHMLWDELEAALDAYQPVPSVQRLVGANMDIDLATPPGTIAWQQDRCPWNRADQTDEHRCATKNVSICRYFRGVEFLDTLLCGYAQVQSE